MKKQYIEPTVLVVNVKIENLMLKVSGNAADGSTADSRQSSSWDDED